MNQMTRAEALAKLEKLTPREASVVRKMLGLEGDTSEADRISPQLQRHIFAKAMRRMAAAR